VAQDERVCEPLVADFGASVGHNLLHLFVVAARSPRVPRAVVEEDRVGQLFQLLDVQLADLMGRIEKGKKRPVTMGNKWTTVRTSILGKYSLTESTDQG
jgi:hypothetical protein